MSFYFKKIRTNLGIPIEALLPYLNKKTLFQVRWKLTDPDEGEKKLKQLIRKSIVERLFDFKTSYGYFVFDFIKQKIEIYQDSDSRKIFMLDLSKENRKLIPYFEKNEFIALQIVSSGEKMLQYAKKLYDSGQYQEYFFLSQFSAELTETLAEYQHHEICDETGNDYKKNRRFSPGYPIWPNLQNQNLFFRLLAPEKIGISLTEEYELVPEHSTSAIIFFNDQ